MFLPKGLVKILAHELKIPLFFIFNYILDSGMCSNIWKKSNIVPIYKKGDPSLPINYRPISILPCLLILFEKKITFLHH